MSLINRVLQDLDARQAVSGAASRFPGTVRALPTKRISRWFVGFVVLFALALAAAAYAFTSWPLAEVSAPPTINAAAGPVIALAPAAAPRAAPDIPAAPSLEPDAETTVLKPSETLSVVAFAADLPRAASEAPAVERKAANKVARIAVAAKAPTAGASAAQETAPAPEAPQGERPASGGKNVKADAPAQVEPRAAARAPVIERTDSVAASRAEDDYRKAIAAVNQGRIGEAVDALHAALRTDSLHRASRQLLVKLLLEARRTEEAVNVLQDGLREQPAAIAWALALARLQVDRGDLVGAVQTLEQSRSGASGNADYQGFLAHLLQRLGRNKEALDHYQAAARLSPGDGRWWLGAGLALDAEGRTTEAREAFLRARQSGNLGADLVALIDNKLR